MSTDDVVFLMIEAGEMFDGEGIICGIARSCRTVESDDADERSTLVSNEFTSEEEVCLIACLFFTECDSIDEHVGGVWIGYGTL